MSKTQSKPTPRDRKLIHIGQAHVLPGMSLALCHQLILEKHHVPIHTPQAWNGIPETTLDAIIADIQALTGGRL